MNHNWYAVITAKVLLSTELSSTQKLLLALISNLSNERGYCFATNDYLGKCLGVSPGTVSNNISLLESSGWIGRVITLNEKKEVEMRILTIIDKDHSELTINEIKDTYPRKEIDPIHENMDTPIHENVEYNNKVLKTNINRVFTPPEISEVIAYFKENGYTEQSAQKAWRYYDTGGWKDSSGKKVKNWKQKMQAVWFKDENKEVKSSVFNKKASEIVRDWTDDDISPVRLNRNK